MLIFQWKVEKCLGGKDINEWIFLFVYDKINIKHWDEIDDTFTVL